ncbi:aspartate aminotransferase family protein [Rhodospirillaceae bacterium KN72]|uniref:Aspartate aminotransferase family protein n=1 Tax=Pacificispira spongiicola TaxID=2729598 RepID=A0A7Y0DXZ4_9PROT|nr:aminotransferase class III-fold pyridoxal phosphate-dependent enzyme [Pacificispira spongiicola]NMM43633.1 aspartate aminotransferase family protein [Pacificispira spongiicola]
MSEAKLKVLEASKAYWNPDKTQFWQDAGVDLVIDKREGYYLYDMDGRRLIDVHLNGGTYNLGHRNPELVEVLNVGARHFDMGNHHFPAMARAALAEELAKCTPEGLKYTIYGAGGAEAVELAIKSARNATRKRKIVSIIKAYHGHSGLSVKTGDERFSKTFLSEDTLGEFVQVPFNDLTAMEDALKGRDVAAVIMETIPATYGFPMPNEGYLPSVKKLCERYDALYIADEVQTGFMRTGDMWGITRYGVTPDIMVIGKGVTGGIYPISCCVVSEQAGAWLKQDGFAHMSTAGGAELGCVVALKVLEITQRPEVRSSVRYVSNFVRAGLDDIRALYPDFFIGIRQHGVIMGLEFNHPEGAKPVMRRLYENGVWAIFSTLDPRVLQFKPGILMTQDLAEEMLRRVEIAVGQARDDVMGGGAKRSYLQ